jgi:hypothetical protein
LDSAPDLVATALAIALSIISDKHNLRGPFIIICSTISIVGYAIVYAAPAGNPGIGYAGTFFATVGVYPSVPIAIAWAGGNVGGDIKRGVAIAMAIGIANLGGSVNDWNLTMPELTTVSEYACHLSTLPKMLRTFVSEMGL